MTRIIVSMTPDEARQRAEALHSLYAKHGPSWEFDALEPLQCALLDPESQYPTPAYAQLIAQLDADLTSELCGTESQVRRVAA